MRGIAQGAELARDHERRTASYRDSRLLRDWRVSLAGALERFAPERS